MVIVVATTYRDSSLNDFYKCRFLNKVTGIYEIQEFKECELDLLTK